MADIFISYKREDTKIAALVGKKLQEEGWHVWWDRNIPIGKAFDKVIEEELSAARCVIVLWTELSIASLNVKEEAAEGLRRNILIPVKIGNTLPPYGFRMIQTLHWNGDPLEEEMSRLVDEVKRLIGDSPVESNIQDKSIDEQDSANDIVHRESKPVEKVKPGKLRFFRKFNWIGAALTFKIYIDGELAGKLAVKETVELSLEPGAHHLRVSGGGTFSDAEEKIVLEPSETMLWEVGYSMTGGAKLSKA